MRFYRPVAPVKAMTFDLDDTLYNNDPIIKRAEATLKHYIAAEYPQTAKLSPQEWTDIKRGLIKAQPALASDMGQLRMHTLRRALEQDIQDPEALEAAAKACFDCFYDARSDFTLDDSVHSVLAQLAEKMPLIAITNGNVDPHKTGLSAYFNVVLHASVTRPAKPSAHMFNEAAAMLSLAPGQILHVGDNLEKDVMGAVKAGYQAAWIAANRDMILNREAATLLPHVELTSLDELLAFT